MSRAPRPFPAAREQQRAKATCEHRRTAYFRPFQGSGGGKMGFELRRTFVSNLSLTAVWQIQDLSVPGVGSSGERHLHHGRGAC